MQTKWIVIKMDGLVKNNVSRVTKIGHATTACPQSQICNSNLTVCYSLAIELI